MGQVLMKKTKKKEVKLESKDEYFIKNGGIFLEKQIALSNGQDTGSLQLKMYSIKDMEKATNGFDPNLIVGAVRSTVYKGSLEGRIVAIKTPVDLTPDPALLDIFLTEASTVMVMSHNNMVKLHGCCFHTFLPILVYEFLPKGSLFERLNGSFSNSLEWADRLRIATDVSYALSYMHNALSKPVVHRDVQSTNILLDDDFHAKLSNFGHSVSITPEEAPKKLPVLGCPGYIDPEYVETQEVTDKCDVYSFGVLMLELFTGRHPYTMARAGMDLVHVFLSSVRNNCIMEAIDYEMSNHKSRDEMERFALLALKCVAKKGMDRPTMIEVVTELWRMQGRETQVM